MLQKISVHNATGESLILAIEPEGEEFRLGADCTAEFDTALTDVQRRLDVTVHRRDDGIAIGLWSVERIVLRIDGKEVLST